MTIQEQRKRGRPKGSGAGVRKEETLIRMQKIIDFVREFHSINHIAPTLKEIAVGIGKRIEDEGNVQVLVKELIREGFLTNMGRFRGRSLAVSKKPPRRWFYKPD